MQEADELPSSWDREIRCRRWVTRILIKQVLRIIIFSENLKLLSVVSRGWLKVHLVGSAEYFKMEKTDINKVCKRLEQKLKDEQEM